MKGFIDCGVTADVGRNVLAVHGDVGRIVDSEHDQPEGIPLQLLLCQRERTLKDDGARKVVRRRDTDGNLRPVLESAVPLAGEIDGNPRGSAEGEACIAVPGEGVAVFKKTVLPLPPSTAKEDETK